MQIMEGIFYSRRFNRNLALNEKYLALEIRGRRYDTSKKLGLLQAQLALGLAGQLRDEVLTTLVQNTLGLYEGVSLKAGYVLGAGYWVHGAVCWVLGHKFYVAMT